MATSVDPAIYRAIADPARRTILDLLLAGERAVLEMLEHFEFSQPALSKHLRVLRDVGLVAVRRVGREQRYSLRAEGLQGVHAWVQHYERFWSDSLDRLGDVLSEMD